MYLLENGQKPKKEQKTPETKLIFPYFDIFETKKFFGFFFQKFFKFDDDNRVYNTCLFQVQDFRFEVSPRTS